MTPLRILLRFEIECRWAPNENSYAYFFDFMYGCHGNHPLFFAAYTGKNDKEDGENETFMSIQ